MIRALTLTLLAYLALLAANVGINAVISDRWPSWTSGYLTGVVAGILWIVAWPKLMKLAGGGS